MILDHDNSSDAALRPAVAQADTAPDRVSPVLTAELALIDMLARLIVDAVQRHAVQPEANHP